MNWGDGTKTKKKVDGVRAGSLAATFTHTYGKRGSYALDWVSVVTGGDCFGASGGAYFTLAKISGTERLAALGDSYSSGEGSGDYYAGTNSAHGCHRSPRAWALQLREYVANRDVIVPSKEYLLACSGGESSALDSPFKGQQSQDDVLQHLLPRPTLITMTMGGNDLGFSDIVSD